MSKLPLRSRKGRYNWVWRRRRQASADRLLRRRPFYIPLRRTLPTWPDTRQLTLAFARFSRPAFPAKSDRSVLIYNSPVRCQGNCFHYIYVQQLVFMYIFLILIGAIACREVVVRNVSIFDRLVGYLRRPHGFVKINSQILGAEAPGRQGAEVLGISGYS